MMMQRAKHGNLLMLGALALLALLSDIAMADDSVTSAELDAFWAEVSRTVAAGDFQGYAVTYHPDAVLVNKRQGTSYPISAALKGWEQGFLDTSADKMVANVEFRFTDLLADDSTAHQTGIFHYTATPAGGEMTDRYVHFEALLIKTNGWKLMMEYQQTMATAAEWAAAE
jgi:ketosteroid isomerase-like protein